MLPSIVRVLSEQWVFIWRYGTAIEPSSFEGAGMLTVRTTILPEPLVICPSGLGVTVADCPHRGFDHGGADEELGNSGQA